LQFADCGNPYDIVRLPGFEFAIEHPQAAYRQALQARFPAQQAVIDRWFEEMDAAHQSARSLLAMRGLPPWLAWGLRLWRGAEVRATDAVRLVVSPGLGHELDLAAIAGFLEEGWP
jgi:all-trans-retinol 13,14-reductase